MNTIIVFQYDIFMCFFYHVQIVSQKTCYVFYKCLIENTNDKKST